MTSVSRRLPDFPWDSLAGAKGRAAQHPGGIVDLSIGSPVDPTPEVVRHALAAAADSPGYPTTLGTPTFRAAAVGWLERRFGVRGLGPDTVLPLIGSKEFIASAALHLGVGAGDTVVIPELAYPTYEVGARLVGADVIATDSTVALGPVVPSIIWINSPSNPTGRILPAEHLRKVVTWARERGALVISDECYLECWWTEEKPVSVLDESVCGGSFEGVLTVHSLSKRSNLAGYRGGFVAGDPEVLAELLAVRKNLGLVMPGPQQAALTAAFDDDKHVEEQRDRYASRHHTLREAIRQAGLRIEHSEAALYLWATRGEPCLQTVEWFADRGILVAPGHFYGSAGEQHVRIAITASDDAIATAAARLSS